MKKLILNLGLMAALCWPAAAGEIITYQGRLKESGTPVTGNRDFEFEFCATPAPGGCVASLSGVQSFQVVNGLFKSTFTAPSVNLSAGPWYLRVKVGADYLSPVEKLTYVPYAVQAASAAYASALAVSAGEGVFASTNVTVAGLLTVSDFSVTPSTESMLGVSTRLQDTNPAGEDIRVAVMGYAQSASPDAKDVLVGGNFEAETPSGMAAGMAVGLRAVNRNEGGAMGKAYGVMIDALQNTAGSVGQAYGLYIGTMTAGTHGSRPYALYSEDTNALTRFAGPVGISSVPAYSLAVSSANGHLFWVAHDGVYATKFVGDGSGLTGVTGASGTDNTKVLKAGDTMTGQLTLAGSSLTVIAPSGYSSSLWVSTSAQAPHLYVSTSGLAGLGTAAPRYRLDAEGSARIFNASQPPSLVFTSNVTDIPGVSGYGASIAGVPEVTAMGMIVRTQSLGTYTERLRVSGTGNVGISTGAPQARMDVLSAGSAPSDMAQIWRDSSGLIVASMSATGQMQAVRYIGDGSGLTGVPANLSSPLGTLAVGDGGTGGTTAPEALANLGAIPAAGGSMTGALTMSASSITVSNLGTQLGFYSDVGGGNIAVPTGQPLHFEIGGSDRMLIDNLGKVAINKTPANYLLDVGGAANFDGQAIVGGTMTVAGGSFSVAGSTLNVGAGRVGIGTSAPVSRLHLNVGNSGYLAMSYDDTAAGWADLAFFDNTSANRKWGIGVFADSHPTMPNSMYMWQNLDRNENPVSKYRMLISDTGLVGISSDTPKYRLVVSSGAGETGIIMAVSTGTSNLFWVAGDGAHALKFTGDGSGLTNVPGDNLGTHTAAQDLNLANYSAVNVASVTIVGKGLQIGTDLTASAAGVFISSYGAIMTIGVGHVGSVVPFSRGNGAVDLQTFRNSGAQAATGDFATLSGGGANMASNGYTVVAGGYQNRAAGAVATVSGGQFNTAIGHNSIALGGKFNTAAGLDSVVSGSSSTASGSYSWAGGYLSSGTAAGSFTWADSQGLHLRNPNQDRTLFKNRGGFMITGSTNTSLGGLADRGLLVTGDGLVGISTGVPYAALDVVSTGTAHTEMAQIWRDSGGLIRSSVSATGVMMASQFVGDGSGLTGVTGDNLGNHVATATLNMSGFPLVNITTIAATSTGLHISTGGTGSILSTDGLFVNPGKGLYFTGKGNGTAIGNVRGTGAVDLQTYRSAAAQVASGTYSTISGGTVNTANANYAIVAGGWDNAASGIFATISGGQVNTATGQNSIVLGGRFNTAAGLDSVVSGSSSTASGNYSWAGGYLSSGTAAGSFTWADSQGLHLLNPYQDRTMFKNRGGFMITGSTNTSLGGLADRGLLVTGDGLLGISTGVPYAALDVVSTGTAHTEMAQIWRDSGGLIRSSVSATGVMMASRFVGDGSGLTGVTASGSVLRAGDTMTGQLTLDGSTLTVTGNAFSVGGSTLTVQNGKVGIRSGAPVEALDIAGRILISTSAGNDSTDGLYSTGANGIKFMSKGQDFMRVGGYNVGLGGPTIYEGASYPRVQVQGNLSVGSSFASKTPPADGMAVQGKVGIGTATPTALLEVRDQAAAHGYVLLVATGTETKWAALAVTTGGIVGVGTLNPSTQTVFHAQAIASNVSAGEDVAFAVMGSAHAKGAGTEDAAVGGHFEASVEATESIGYLVGLHTNVRRKGSGAGTVSKAIGIYVDNLENQFDTGVIGDTMGLFISTLTATGQSNKPYAIYSADPNARSYFAGPVGIGSHTAQVALVISSAPGSSDPMLIVSTGSSVIFGVKGNGEVYTAGKYIGDGSLLTGVVAAGGVQKAGDSMTGQLTLDGSTLTVTGNAFSVGGSTLAVAYGRVGIGTGTPTALLEVRDQSASKGYVLVVGTGTASDRAALVVTTGGVVAVGTMFPSTQTYFNAHMTATDRTWLQEDVSLGLVGSVRVESSGVEDAAAGAHFEAEVEGSAVIGLVAGMHASVRRHNGAAGSIGKAMGVFIEDFENEGGGGMITDTYGIYIGTLTTGGQTNLPYAIYSEDPAARSYFAGRIGISSATPSHALVISSAAGTSEVMLVVSTGSSVIFGVKGNGEVYTAGKFIGDGSALTNLSISSITVPEDGLQIATSTYAGASGVIISSGGAIQTTGPGHGSFSGNARGNGAVDLQTYRDLPTQVASGEYSSLTGGIRNTAYGKYSVVGGGYGIYAGGEASFVGGGWENQAPGNYSAIAGGVDNNTDWGQHSFIGGGLSNTVNGERSVIGGGAYNVVTASNSAVGGGAYNVVLGSSSVVAGGEYGVAAGRYSAVLGGWESKAQGPYSVVGGGKGNNSQGNYATLGGGYMNTIASGGSSGVIGGGELNVIASNAMEAAILGGGSNYVEQGSWYGTVAGGYSNAVGPESHASSILGGSNNRVYASSAAVVGGDSNVVLGTHSFIGGGQANQAGGAHSALAGGMNNRSDGQYAFVGGGYQNRADSVHSAVVGGWFNQAMEMDSFIGGGLGNIINAGGSYAAIVGGSSNTINGQHSSVLGGQFNQTLSAHSAILGGLSNTISGTNPGAIIGGGESNDISANGWAAVIAGGWDNQVSSKYSAILGGRGNRVYTGEDAVVVAGSSNTAIGTASVVVGGRYNTAKGQYTFVGGGGPGVSEVTGNYAEGSHSAIVGGSSNTVTLTGTGGFIGGGWNNSVHGEYGVVPGGVRNFAGGDYSFAAGSRSTSAANGTFTWNDTFPGEDLVNSVVNQAMFKTSGGFWVSTGTIYQTPALFVSNNNNVVLGTAAVRLSRLTVAEPDPSGLTGNKYVLRVGTGTIQEMLSVSTSGVVSMDAQSVVIASAPPMALALTGWNGIGSLGIEEMDTQDEFQASLFTARNPGRYLVTLNATMNCATPNNVVGVGVGVNGEGSPSRYATAFAGIAGIHAVSFSQVYNLPAGGTLQFFFYNTLASAFNNFVPKVTITKLN